MKATRTARSGVGRIAAAVGVVLAWTVGFFAFAPGAYAHHPVVTGVSACEDDGTFTVTWEVGNSESDPSRYMLVREYSVTPDVGTTTGLTADDTYDGIIGPGYPGPGTLVSPSGEVAVTTSEIPASTTSVTLTVTGGWTYPGGGARSSASYTVELGGTCEPKTGSLSISKVVKGNTAPDGATYTVDYDDGAGTSGSVTVQGGETVTVDDLPYGSYTLSEVDAPEGATISPNPAVVGTASPHVAVTVTNPYPDVGGISVTKDVSGAVDGYVEGSTFGFTLDCPGTGMDESFDLEAGETANFDGIPLGTTCTVSEVSLPDPVPGYEYGEPVLDPAGGTVTVGSTTKPVTVSVENPLVRLPAPAADVVDDCESGGALVTLTNDGGGEVVFQIVVDGEDFGPTHVVGPDGETTVLVPLAEDETATITVEADGFGILTEEVVQHDCQSPSASFEPDCAEGGVVVTLTNDGESPVELTVTKDGEVVDTVEVGDTPVEVVVPMDEDTTATIAVTDGEQLVDEQEVTYDCSTPPDTTPPDTTPPEGDVEVLGIEQSRPTETQSGALPQTGSNGFGLALLGAGLVLGGVALVGMTRRRS